MRRALIALVGLYRYLFSPWLGSNCRFFPSCSCYAQQALQQYGATKGTWMTVKRIARCHPWHPGGYDPLPTNTAPHATHQEHTGNCSHG